MVSKVKSSQSSPLIWVALLITLGAVIWTAMQDESATGADDLLAEPTARVQSGNIASDSGDGLLDNETKVAIQAIYPWQQVDRVLETKGIKDLFASHSWEEKKKVVKTKPTPPPPPQAPPLPFTYMGKLDQGTEGVQVFLMQSDKVLTVSVGENVNQLWRLDEESESGLTFTYIPLDQQKMMSKGASGSTNMTNGRFNQRPRNSSALRRQMQQLNFE